ncbi:hypothetical protein B0O80DRAFT_454191 [Mortierella sp. GBAus27b]|nr:hypothetical protein B0O80DRAFT_454191 [Mortierella sp. GBAus27b]
MVIVMVIVIVMVVMVVALLPVPLRHRDPLGVVHGALSVLHVVGWHSNIERNYLYDAVVELRVHAKYLSLLCLKRSKTRQKVRMFM